jgi:hypothetical protein
MQEIGSRFDLLIVDEVHHFGGGLRDEALEMAIAGARLGLTATPPRDVGATACLATLVGPTVFELVIGDLAGGFLASFDAITLYLDLSREDRSAYTSLSALFNGVYAEFRRTAPDATWADFSRQCAGTPRVVGPSRHGDRCDGCFRSRAPSVAGCDPYSNGTETPRYWFSPPITTRPMRLRVSTS